MNYPAAEQRGIRDIHNRLKGGEFMRLGRINAPEAHKTLVRRFCGGLADLYAD